MALDFAREAVGKRFATKPHVLVELARAIVRTAKYAPDSPELTLASKAADRARSLAGEDNAFATAAVARVLFAKGEKGRAIKLQRSALERAKTKDEKADMQTLLDFMLKN